MRGHRRAVDHVGGVEPAAQADLEQHEVGRRAREGEKGRGRRDLEEGDRLAAVGLLALRPAARARRVVVDQLAGERGCAR